MEAVSRRAVLAAAVVGAPIVLAACSSSSSASGDTAASDEAAGSDAASREHAIIALYDAVLSSGESLGSSAAMLQLIRDQHAAHAAALGAESGDAPKPSFDTADPVRSLIKAEKAIRKAHADAARISGAEDVTRLLTVIAASEASHVPALKRVKP